MNKREVGTQQELQAARYLESEGCRILERNFRTRQGEIDLIVLDGETLVFLEVKYRKNSSFGEGAEAVNPGKQRRIIRCAGYYLMKHPEYEQQSCRFDVISIAGNEITHYRDAFWIT